ncbi:cell wall metabolism sensor histidine kinase WalK [Caldalkalibacillus salinus]|uniref:cell wall metabolism sensor histidine kinase WalK n=1 Tax=Caldalkalibacillus salinus TaxID=2803787 RepID=UPI0019236B1E|nr:cell wall metabolism sensor histidine kinase WalK [Caldalkalibacillus salinus]
MKKPLSQRFTFYKSIHWRIIVIYTLLILMAMQVISAYFMKSLETHYVNNFTKMIEQQASLFAYSIQGHFIERMDTTSEGTDEDNIHLMMDQIFSTPNIDVQVLDQNGIVIATSDQQGTLGQRNTQREVMRALSGTRDDDIRVNPNNGHRTRILTLPVKVADGVVGAVYVMASMEEVYQTVQDINKILVTGTTIALVLTAALGVTLARTITSPLKEMTRQATSMADGDFSRKVNIYGQDEIGQLAHAFNDLSHRLSKALNENEEERSKLASILFHMSDGVIATDHEGRIMLINPTALGMLEVKEEEVSGLYLSDILPLPEAFYQPQKFSHRPYIVEVGTKKEKKQLLQVNMSVLQKEGEPFQGVIVVLLDVTQQEKLERERKDFVANVSHELRTPLTTVKSYLEALEDGVIEDPELAPKFVQVTHTETDRMIRLVNDLLQLSKMDAQEQLGAGQAINVTQLLDEVIDRFSVALSQRRLSADLHLNQKILVEGDRDQMIQVFDNIISNAIKYSNPEGDIKVYAQDEGETVLLQVIDQGVGIPQEDIKHLFKRFYRVDKARSREMGGTGLGLSIAKDIIEVHGGEIWIDSELGQGTTVFIRLPVAHRHTQGRDLA